MGAMKLAKTLVIVRGLITEALGLIFQKKKRNGLNFEESFEPFGLIIIIMVMVFVI